MFFPRFFSFNCLKRVLVVFHKFYSSTLDFCVLCHTFVIKLKLKFINLVSIFLGIALNASFAGQSLLRLLIEKTKFFVLGFG